MRIDVLLDTLCLVKTRSLAKKICDNNLVTIDGKTAKPSQMVHGGEEIHFSLYGYRTKFRLKEVPAGNVSKKNAGEYYEILEKERLLESEPSI